MLERQQEELAAYWQASKPRERRVVVIGGAFGLLIMIWVLAINPLNGALAKQHRLHQILTKQYTEATSIAGQLLAQNSRPKGNTKSGLDGNNISQTISQSLSRHGLVLSNYRPDSNVSARVEFSEIDFNRLLPWLADVDQSNQLVLKSMKVSALGKPGLVQAAFQLGAKNDT